MRKNRVEYYLHKAAQGLLLSLVVLAVLFTYNKDVLLAQFCLYETLPGYDLESSVKSLFVLLPDNDDTLVTSVYAAGGVVNQNPSQNIQPVEAVAVDAQSDIIGLQDVIFQPETDKSQIYNHFNKEHFTIDDVDALRDITQLKNKFYAVDNRTDLTVDLFNIDNFLKTDLTINNTSKGPKVLVFHTHSSEMYADSKGKDQGVVGVGELLCKTLEEQYGIETMHQVGNFDVVNGKYQVMGAYERMEPVISKILKENPSIQVVIDLHRDGVPDNTKLATTINGKDTAQIMFVNGISKLYNEGTLENISSLPNPNLKDNLAFSFNMQLAANSLYPGFSRKVYINAYRYSLHMRPKSLLVEVGAQTNTEEEARNAVAPLAEVLAQVVLP